MGCSNTEIAFYLSPLYCSLNQTTASARTQFDDMSAPRTAQHVIDMVPMQSKLHRAVHCTELENELYHVKCGPGLGVGPSRV